MYEITEHYEFMATHEIYGVSDQHPCSGVHRHRWTAELLLATSRLLPADGRSESAALEPFRLFVLNELSGKHLNDLISGPAVPARLATLMAAWCEQNLTRSVAGTLASVTVATDTGLRARYIFPRVLPSAVH